VKEQLDILKDQCADLESKWEDADVKYNKMLAELEERKTSNVLALTDTEMKGLLFRRLTNSNAILVVQLTQVVRSLRNDTNEIDDRIEQAQEYMSELDVKLDESSRSDRRSDTGNTTGTISEGKAEIEKTRQAKPKARRRL